MQVPYPDKLQHVKHYGDNKDNMMVTCLNIAVEVSRCSYIYITLRC